MKPVHIVILVVVSIGIALSISFYGDTSRYVCFKEADSIALKRPDMKLHVVCSINKDLPQVYEPSVNPNYFEFHANDTTGMVKTVILRDSKPTDLDKTDKIVLIGYSRGEHFEAVEILKKCPSKYEKK